MEAADSYKNTQMQKNAICSHCLCVCLQDLWAWYQIAIRTLTSVYIKGSINHAFTLLCMFDCVRLLGLLKWCYCLHYTHKWRGRHKWKSEWIPLSVITSYCMCYEWCTLKGFLHPDAGLQMEMPGSWFVVAIQENVWGKKEVSGTIPKNNFSLSSVAHNNQL